MAALAAALIGAGTSKCGWPMLRFTGSFRLRASSKILRIPDDSMCCIRSAIQRSCVIIIGLRFALALSKQQWAIRSPLERFQFVSGRADEVVGQVIQGSLDLAHPLGPIVSFEREALM